MARQRLHKTNLLRKGWEFEKVYSKGKRVHGNGFTLICWPNQSDQSRLGVSIHRKIRGAVKRNRIKRIIRESFRLGRDNYPAGVDIVFTVRPDFTLSRSHDIQQAVSSLAQKFVSFRGADADDN